jgi:hypothetical protein
VDPAAAQVLVPALGVSISPVPVAAVLVILLARRPGPTSTSFLAGWIGGIALVLAGAAALGRAIGIGAAGTSPVLSALAVTIGAVALALAARYLLHARRGAARSRWVAALDSLSPAGAFGIGLLLSAVNPKNLALLVAAGLALGGTRPGGPDLLVGAAFVLLASSTVLVPVAVHRAIGDRAEPVLAAVRTFLTRYETLISVLVLLVTGTVLVAHGFGGLASALYVT